MQKVNASGRRIGRFGALLMALALGACGRSNTLEGSLTEIIDLSFTEAEVQRGADAVVIAYTRPKGEGKDTVFRLVVKVRDIEPGAELTLVEGENGIPATASRAVADDPVRNFPPIRRGMVLFDSDPLVGGGTSGEFRATFGDGGDAGKGTTVFGTFTVARVATGEAI